MRKATEIDLVGEILPIGLLKCKHALESMSPHAILSVYTDDPSVVENVIRYIHSGRYRLVGHHRKQGVYRLRIRKEDRSSRPPSSIDTDTDMGIDRADSSGRHSVS